VRARLGSTTTPTTRPGARITRLSGPNTAVLALQRQLGNQRVLAMLRATTRQLQRAKLEVSGSGRERQLKADGMVAENFKFDVHTAGEVVSTFGSSLEELCGVAKQTISKTTRVGAYAMQESLNKSQGYGAATLYFAALECKNQGFPVLLAPSAVSHAISFYGHLGMVKVSNPVFGTTMVGNVDQVLKLTLESLKKHGHEV
jgi:hypothetical protein